MDKALAAKTREAGEYLIKKSEELAHEGVEILDIHIDVEKNELDGRWEKLSYTMKYNHAPVMHKVTEEKDYIIKKDHYDKDDYRRFKEENKPKTLDGSKVIVGKAAENVVGKAAEDDNNGILTLPIEATIRENPLTHKLEIGYWDNGQYIELSSKEMTDYLKQYVHRNVDIYPFSTGMYCAQCYLDICSDHCIHYKIRSTISPSYLITIILNAFILGGKENDG